MLVINKVKMLITDSFRLILYSFICTDHHVCSFINFVLSIHSFLQSLINSCSLTSLVAAVPRPHGDGSFINVSPNSQ